MSSGLAGALVAAVLYGAASVVQAIGVRRAAATPAASLIDRAWSGRWYAAGLAMDALGYAASVVALRTLPLFVVQSALASSVAVTAILAVAVLHAHIGRAQLLALAAIAVGLVALALSAQEGGARALTGVAPWLLLGGAALVAVLAFVGLPRTDVSPVLLALAAGLGFGGTGIATRVITLPHPWWHLLGSPVLWALAAYGVISLVAYALALERGAVTTTAALAFAVETLVPSAIGLWFLGDRVRAGLVPVAALGFVLTLAGCIALAQYAEIEPPRPAHP